MNSVWAMMHSQPEVNPAKYCNFFFFEHRVDLDGSNGGDSLSKQRLDLSASENALLGTEGCIGIVQ